MEGDIFRENVCSTFSAKFENGHMGVDFNDPIYIVNELSMKKVGNMFFDERHCRIGGFWKSKLSSISHGASIPWSEYTMTQRSYTTWQDIKNVCHDSHTERTFDPYRERVGRVVKAILKSTCDNLIRTVRMKCGSKKSGAERSNMPYSLPNNRWRIELVGTVNSHFWQPKCFPLRVARTACSCQS